MRDSGVGHDNEGGQVTAREFWLRLVLAAGAMVLVIAVLGRAVDFSPADCVPRGNWAGAPGPFDSETDIETHTARGFNDSAASHCILRGHTSIPRLGWDHYVLARVPFWLSCIPCPCCLSSREPSTTCILSSLLGRERVCKADPEGKESRATSVLERRNCFQLRTEAFEFPRRTP